MKFGFFDRCKAAAKAFVNPNPQSIATYDYPVCVGIHRTTCRTETIKCRQAIPYTTDDREKEEEWIKDCLLHSIICHLEPFVSWEKGFDEEHGEHVIKGELKVVVPDA